VAVSSDELTSHRLAAGWQPVDDWTTLEGSFAEFHQRGRILDEGKVDVVTPDGKVLWLEHEGALPRRIIEKQADIFARLLPSR
jgi:hypothetical protein